MIIRILFSFFIAFAAGAAVVPTALAQPSGFGAVTPEKVAELEAMHQQAMDSLLKNDFQAAIRVYSDILLLEPDDETAYTGLGQIYMIQGHFEKAHEVFESALQINPYNEVALLGIQRIMDPDGVKGVISRYQAQTEPPLPAQAPAPSPAPQALMAKRRSAVKAKKSIPLPAKRNAPRLGKLGLLHAQRVQMALRKAGFYEGPVNGMIGANTKEALREFQKDFGIETSGRVTSATWAKLSEYLTL